MQAELVQAVQDDPAADPQHRDRADEGQRGQQIRHRGDEELAESLRQLGALFAQVQADVVELHDQRHRAIDEQRHRYPDDRQHARADDEVLRCHFVERDRHDLRRQDQIGPDRARDTLFLEGNGIGDLVIHRQAVFLAAQLLHHLFRPFVGQVAAPEHEDEDDRAG